MSVVFGSVSPSSHLSNPASIVFSETSRGAYKCVSLCRSGTVLRSIEPHTWPTELTGASQQIDGSKEEAISCSWKMHNSHARQRSSKGRFSNKSRCRCKAKVQDAHFHYRSAAKFATAHLMFGAVLGFSGHVAVAATRDMTVRGMDRDAEGPIPTGKISVRPGVKIEDLEVMGLNEENGSPTPQGHLFSKNVNVSVLKIEGLEESNAKNARAEQQLSSNYASESVKKSVEKLSKDGFLSLAGIKLTRFKQQIGGKVSDVTHWWKDIHEAYREDTAAWGLGTNPIFTVYEGPGERVERVTIDEKEIQRRAGIEPLLPDFADEANKALAQERIMRAKKIAQDIEVGNMQPGRNSTLFVLIKYRSKDESQHTHMKIFNHIGSAAHTAAPVVRTAFMVVAPVYGLCVLWGAYGALNKQREGEGDASKDEESAASLIKMRRLKAQMIGNKDQKGEDTQGRTQSRVGPSDFVKKLTEVREMAKKLRSGEGIQTPVKAEADADSIPFVGNALGSQKQIAGDKANTQTEVSWDRQIEKDIREGQILGPEDRSRTLEKEPQSASVSTDRGKSIANGSSQASGLIDQVNSPDSPSKPSFGIKPRIIMSPEEARKTLALKRSSATTRASHTTDSDVNHNSEASNTESSNFNLMPISDETITDGTISSSKREPHPSRDESTADKIYNEPSELSSSAWSGSSNSGSKWMQSNPGQTTNVEEEVQNERGMKQNEVERLVSNATEAHDELAKAEAEEEPDWMENEALREVVFKVRENEEAGREPFFGLDSDKEKLFMEGIFKRIKKEGDRTTKRMKDRRENVDYGLHGIGGDPLEEHLPHQKDPNEVARSPMLDKAIEDKQKVVRDNMGIQQSRSSSSLANLEYISSSSPSFFDHSDAKVSKEEVQPQKPKKILSRNSKKILSRNLKKKFSSSSGNTVVVGSGQPLRKEESFQNTKRWGKELQKRYDSERDPEMRALLKEIGSELDSWVTEKEVEDAWNLSQQLEQGQEEPVHQHYKSVQKKIQEQKQRFGLEAVLDKYKEYQPEPEDQLWWLDLRSVLCLMVIPKGEDGGFYCLDMTLDLEESSHRQDKHIIAFQDRKDALNFCSLLQLRSESKFDHAEVRPFSPRQLYKIAKSEGFKVTVLREGQIRASVGQSLEEVEELILEIGRSVYWDQLERERAVDIDSIVDQGFGL